MIWKLGARDKACKEAKMAIALLKSTLKVIREG